MSVIQPPREPREVVNCVSGADARRGSPGAQVKGDGEPGDLQVELMEYWYWNLQSCIDVLYLA